MTMKMSRFVAALVILIFVEAATSQLCAQRNADVLIFGAGIAGIAAAKTLNDREENITFIILEGEENIGGRLLQGEIGGVKVELGSNWIQGIDPLQPDKHPLWKLAQDCRGHPPEGRFSDYESLKVYLYDEERDLPTDITDRLHTRAFSDAYEVALRVAESRKNDSKPDISAELGLAMAGWTPLLPEDRWVEWFNFDFCFGEPPAETSLFRSGLATYEDFGDPARTTDYFVHDTEAGFVDIIRCLAEDFNHTIRFNTTVRGISYNRPDECICANVTGSENVTEYCAPYGIVTFGVGVLQNSTVQFNPELPEGKRNAINNFTVTHYLNIFAEFREPFWDDVEYIGYVNGTGPGGYYPLFQPLNRFQSDANVLRVTVIGEMANRIVNAADPETMAKEEIAEVLQNIYPNKSASYEPINITIPRWYTNEFFQGTYINTPVDVTENAHTQLAEPLDNGRLHFSGTATNVKYWGFAHGALFSGYDAAEEVIKAMSSGSNIAGRAWLIVLLPSFLILLNP